MNSRILQTIVVALASFTTIAGTDIFIPSLPSLTTYFGASENAVQLSIPLYLVGSLFAAPILGVLSDHFGRRTLMFSGMGLFLFGTILCIYSPSLPVFLTARFIQGFGAVTAPVVGWAMIQDLYPADESAKIMSWMGSIISISPLLAPALGGYIHAAFGWQSNFILIFILTMITLTLMFFVKPKVKPRSQKEKFSLINSFTPFAQRYSVKLFLYCISFFGLLTCGEWCIITLIAFYFENTLHLSPEVFGLYLSLNGLFYILGTLLAPMSLNWCGVNKTLRIGIILTLVASGGLLCVAFVAPTVPLLIMVAIGLYFVGTAMVWGPSTSRALQRFEKTRGAASALRGLLLNVSFALGGFAGSLLNDSSLIPLALFLLTMAIGCWIIFQRYVKLEHP